MVEMQLLPIFVVLKQIIRITILTFGTAKKTWLIFSFMTDKKGVKYNP